MKLLREWSFGVFVAVVLVSGLLGASLALLSPMCSPWRWTAYHLLYFVPVFFAICACVFGGRNVTHRGRFYTALLQASYLSYALYEYYLRFDVPPPMAVCGMLAFLSVFVGLFMLVTWLGAGVYFAVTSSSERNRCEVCGYDLYGLPEPRCPECGTRFDPASASDRE